MPPAAERTDPGVPLSAEERYHALSLLRQQDPAVADRFAPILLSTSDDAVLSLLRELITSQNENIRAASKAQANEISKLSEAMDRLGLRVLGLVGLSMALNAALVGVSITFSYGGWELTTTSTEAAIEEPVGDAGGGGGGGDVTNDVWDP